MLKTVLMLNISLMNREFKRTAFERNLL